MKTKISTMSSKTVYSSNCASSIVLRSTASFDSLQSYDSSNTHYSASEHHHQSTSIVKDSSVSSSSSSSSLSMAKTRSLSLKKPFMRRSTASTSVETMRSVPSSTSSGKTSNSGGSSAGDRSSTMSMTRSKHFFNKVPKIFDHKFELPFTGHAGHHGNSTTAATSYNSTSASPSVKASNRQSRTIGPIMLSRRSRKPSMLEFSCIGAADLCGPGSMMSMTSPPTSPTPLPTKRATFSGSEIFKFDRLHSNRKVVRESTINSIAPRIDWSKPEIDSDWNDLFANVS